MRKPSSCVRRIRRRARASVASCRRGGSPVRACEPVDLPDKHSVDALSGEECAHPCVPLAGLTCRAAVVDELSYDLPSAPPRHIFLRRRAVAVEPARGPMYPQPKCFLRNRGKIDERIGAPDSVNDILELEPVHGWVQYL